MPLVFDSVFTAALARELDDRWSGRRLEALRFERDDRLLRLEFRDEAWVWPLHPQLGVPTPIGGASAGFRRDRGRGRLESPHRITAVESPLDTRRLEVRLDGPDETEERLVVDLVTNRWNAIHVVAGRVRAVLVPDLGRSPVVAGDEWSASTSHRRWARTPPDPVEWAAFLAELDTEHDSTARRHVAWLSAANEAYVLGPEPRPGTVDQRSPGRNPEASLRRYLELRDAARRDPPAGWLLPEDRTSRAGDSDAAEAPTVHPYPASLGRRGAERVGSTLDALAAYAERSPRVTAALRAAAEDPETTRLREALERRRERARRKISGLEREVDTVRDPEELRQLGHLLLARKAAVPAGADEVDLEDFAGGRTTIELDPTLDAVGNAEAYYDRAKRVERAAAELPKRIAKSRRRIEDLEAALARLEETGPDEDAWKLAGGKRRVLGGGTGRRGPGSRKGRDADAERLPYRVFRTSSGLEVRAGRSAKANDELTFHHSAPDDVWMHVREAAGSHVVLRWGRKDQNPPERDLAEAALVAAVLSRARGSTVVPVAWTRRKYVRKPRKAAPGAVLPERTRTVFVEPDARRVEEMAEEE